MNGMQPDRRRFLGALAAESAGAALAVRGPSAVPAMAANGERDDRKIRVGFVGYGVCRFGAQLDSRTIRTARSWRSAI